MMTTYIRKGLIRALYLIVALVLLVLSFKTYIVLERIKLANAQIADHLHHRNLLVTSYEAFKDMETSTRGFVMLKDPLFFSSRTNGLIRMETSLKQLNREYSADSMQMFYKSMDSLFHKRSEDLSLILISKDSSLTTHVLAQSAAVLEKARLLVESQIEKEDSLIKKYNADITGNIYSAPGPLLTLAIISIIFLVISYFWLEKELRMSKQLQTDLKDSYEKLARRKKLLRTILNTNPNGIIAYEAVRDEEGRITDFRVIFASGKIMASGDKSVETIIGKLATELYPNLKQTGFLDKLIEVTITGTSQSFETYYPFDGNVGGWFEIYLARMNDGVMVNGREITRIKNTEEKLTRNVAELEKSNAQLKEFTFIASHDLQEPLRKVSTFANKLLDDKKLNSKLHADVVKIKEASVRMSQLLESITGFTRLQVSSTKLQPVDLNKVLTQTLIDLEMLIAEKKADITCEGLPTINCDPNQISQLFFHIISNSLKFNDKKPEIRISFSLVEDNSEVPNLDGTSRLMRLRFEDNGIGFENKFQHKLFMIFQRLHNDKNYPGTGIGLAMCRKIAENHNGTINAFSNPGTGSIFDVYLPAELKNNLSNEKLQAAPQPN